MTADGINNLGRTNSNRRRRQTVEDNTDPVFNMVNVASTMETTTTSDEGTNNPPSGGSASVIATSYSLLFALTLLAMFML